MTRARDGLRMHGGVALTTRTHRGRRIRRVVGHNLETTYACNSIAVWLASQGGVVAPVGPGFIALGTGPMNLLTAEQADFETGVVGWSAVSNCSIAQSSTKAWSNLYSMALTASSSASMTAGTPTGASGIPVTATDGVSAYQYMAAAHVLAATTGRTVTVSILWYNSAGTLLSTSTGTGVADSTSAWVRPWVIASAPAGAARAAVEVTVASAGSSEVHYVDAVQFAYAPDGPYAWATGGITGTPTSADTYLTQERAATRAAIDQGTSQNQLTLLLKTYQLTDPAGTFSEAGLFDAACSTTSLEAQASAGAESLTLNVGAPAVSAGQPIYIATDPLTPPVAPSFSAPSTTGGYLTGGQTYYYMITATNSLGESTVGAEASYAVPSGTNTNQITLTWMAVTGATGYNVYRGTSSGTEQKLGSVSGTNTYVDNTNTTPSGAIPTSDSSGGGGEYAIVAVSASAGAGSWTLSDFLLRSHPAGAVVTVFNGNMWGHVAAGDGLSAAAVKTSQQLLTCEWALTVSAS